MDLSPPRLGLTGRAEVSVRPASPADASEIARVQAVTWRTAYRTLLPPAVLDEWDDAAVADAWRAAVQFPPTPAHHVLVAEEAGTLVGFASCGPADPDAGSSSQARDWELGTLLVEPRWGRRGHGSRLLAAVVDIARAEGVTRLRSWLPESDEVSGAFLEGAGWARDGWGRSLDTGANPFREVRWETLLTDETDDERGTT